MGKTPLPYELTRAAEQDLREVAHYTLREWGQRQAFRYASQLEACFQGIADNTVLSKSFSNRYPLVRVTRCKHHFIFFIHASNRKPQILAVLHERMDLVARLADRLSP